METSNQLLFVFLLAFVAMAGATQFKVGGSNGWTLPAPNTDSYNQWAARNRFRIGDSLGSYNQRLNWHCVYSNIHLSFNFNYFNLQ
jgi:hypothetical protein